MADSGTGDPGTTRAAWALLTNLLDLLVDKGVLTHQDMLALADTAHQELSASDQAAATAVKTYRDSRKSRG